MKKSSGKILSSLLLLSLSPKLIAQSNLPDEIDFISYQSKADKLAIEVKDLQGKIAILIKEKQDLETNLPLIRSRALELSKKAEELNKLIEAKQKKDVDLTVEVQTFQGSIQSITNDLNVVISQLTAISARAQSEGAEMGRIEAHIVTLQGQSIEANNRLINEKKEESLSMRAIDDLSRDLNVLNQEEGQLRDSRRDLVTQNSINQKDLPVVKNLLSKKEVELSPKQAQLSKAQQDLNQTKNEVTTLQNQLTTANQQLSPLRSQKQKLETELAPLKSEVAALRSTLSSQETQLAQLIQKKENGVTDKANLIKQISDLDAAMATNEKNISEYQARIVTEEQNMASITVELNKARKALSDLEARNLPPSELREARRLVKKLEGDLSLSKQTRDNSALAMKGLRDDNIKKTQDKVKANQSLAELETFLSQAETLIAAKKNEVEQNKAAINLKDGIIAPKQADLTSIISQITPIELQLNALQSNLSQAKQREQSLTTQVQSLLSQVGQITADINAMKADIATMENQMAAFPQEARRIEARLNSLEITQQDKLNQLSREQKLLVRIRQNIPTLEAEAISAKVKLENRVKNRQDQLLVLQAIENEKNQKFKEKAIKETLIQAENQNLADSVRRQTALRVSLKSDQDLLVTTESQLSTDQTSIPKMETRLSSISGELNPLEQRLKVATPELDSTLAQIPVRQSLYEKYLKEAVQAGASVGKRGEVDGSVGGEAEAKKVALTRGESSGLEEGKWQAILRSHVRGEINGYDKGLSDGLSSESDVNRGFNDGRAEGLKAAADFAQLTLKPQFYQSAFQTLLSEADLPEVMSKELKLSQNKIKAQAKEVSKIAENIPVLSNEELRKSQGIISPLDEKIQKAQTELSKISSLRASLSRADLSYVSVSSVPSVSASECQKVYKKVSEFVAACESKLKSDYSDLFKRSHELTFKAVYPQAFASVVGTAFESELQKNYKSGYDQAFSIAQSEGLRVGKIQAYESNFNAQREMAYQESIDFETTKAKQEAQSMAQQYFSKNGVSGLVESPSLENVSRFGISSGTSFLIATKLKNAGAKDLDSGAVQLKIKSVSGPVKFLQLESPLPMLPSKKVSNAKLNLGATVLDTANPGEKVVIEGVIIHPGNDFQSMRSEKFSIEERIALNPSAQTNVIFDATPKASNLFGGKKHSINVDVTALYSGLNAGYNVSMEIVGSTTINLTKTKDSTKVLTRGQKDSVELSYKLSKADKGKVVQLKVKVEFGTLVISEKIIEIRPE